MFNVQFIRDYFQKTQYQSEEKLTITIYDVIPIDNKSIVETNLEGAKELEELMQKDFLTILELEDEDDICK